MEKESKNNGPIDKAEDLVSSYREYVDLKIESIKLKLIESLSKLFSRLLFVIIFIMLIGAAIAYLSSSFSWWIGDILGSKALGSLITAAIFLLFAIILFFKRKIFLLDSIVKMMIEVFYEDKD